MNSKKSQTEILGLAIIVVFIAIALLFVVKFMINSSAESPREEFIQSELASNILGSAIDATTDCRNQDIADLLKDCAENNPGSFKCGSLYSCEFAENELSRMLSGFMDAMGGGKAYKLRSFIGDNSLFEISEGNCTVWESATQPLPTRKGTLNVQFNMCN